MKLIRFLLVVIPAPILSLLTSDFSSLHPWSFCIGMFYGCFYMPFILNLGE